MFGNMVKNKIPEGWENYSAIGDKVPGTCFLTFKVPLKEEILRRSSINNDDWFTPSILLQKVPNLKLVIDLTNTHRYYNIKEVTGNGVYHEKIKVPGGGYLPPVRYLKRFCDVVDSFLDQYGNDHVIGVHCTHGVNRTGYFVCKYMVTRMGMLPEQAIKNFEMARGHTMNRPLLVNNILNIHNDTRELRVENYFNTLNTTVSTFQNSMDDINVNEDCFVHNYEQKYGRNLGNQEIDNWQFKRSNAFGKWRGSGRRSNNLKDEENRMDTARSYGRKQGQGYNRNFQLWREERNEATQRWPDKDTEASANFHKRKSKRNKWKRYDEKQSCNSVRSSEVVFQCRGNSDKSISNEYFQPQRVNRGSTSKKSERTNDDINRNITEHREPDRRPKKNKKKKNKGLRGNEKEFTPMEINE